jgi:hypothetical protein
MFFNNINIFGQEFNLYFETQHGKYDFANVDTINASIFRNKIVVLNVKNNKPGDVFKISSKLGFQIVRKDSLNGTTYVSVYKFSRLITEEIKKVIQEQNSQVILLPLIVNKYRGGKFVESITVKASLRIMH